MATLEFLGATGTVTGSKILVETGAGCLLVDCGLYQGLKALRERNWERLPVEPASIDWVVLTRGHIDHTGYLPRLVKDGFRGHVYSTRATADLLKILLPDSGHLQEEEAAYHNKRGTVRSTDRASRTCSIPTPALHWPPAFDREAAIGPGVNAGPCAARPDRRGSGTVRLG